MRKFRVVPLALCVLLALPAASTLPVASAQATPGHVGEPPASGPTAVGFGGAVATVDATATQAGLDVLQQGGNAVDAAVAAAATLGVTEPFSAGIGGGGFLVYYDARTGHVSTIDGREAAPASMTGTAFVDPVTGLPYAFQEARVSGLSVGVPGTLATWQEALNRWGTRSLSDSLRPAIGVAEQGFTVDQIFAGQVAGNAEAFGQFGSTSELYLPGGRPPAVGSTLRNPDLARTYDLVARDGIQAFYGGPIGQDIAATVQHPPLATTPNSPWPFPIRPAALTAADLAGYQVRLPAPTHVRYRGLDVYGMATPSSGGSTVGEALNILAASDPAGRDPVGRDPAGGDTASGDTAGGDRAASNRTQALHRYLEASALAFADRNRYVGDATPRALLDELLTGGFAAERACQINPSHALVKPVTPGTPDGSYGGCASTNGGDAPDAGMSTTNLTVADRWGNVVEYTFTIEQIGGNAMVVPGRGFLLNNELTDFNFTSTQAGAPDPNLPAAGKRPRSSMAPTIVLRDGRPWLAVGSPGGSTIITTVLQILVNRIDFGMTLPEAIAAPRASQRNSASISAEPDFITSDSGVALHDRFGHAFTSTAEIGAATGVEFLPGGRILAAAEPVRRGGGSAAVVR